MGFVDGDSPVRSDDGAGFKRSNTSSQQNSTLVRRATNDRGGNAGIRSINDNDMVSEVSGMSNMSNSKQQRLTNFFKRSSTQKQLLHKMNSLNSGVLTASNVQSQEVKRPLGDTELAQASAAAKLSEQTEIKCTGSPHRTVSGVEKDAGSVKSTPKRKHSDYKVGGVDDPYNPYYNKGGRATNYNRDENKSEFYYTENDSIDGVSVGDGEEEGHSDCLDGEDIAMLFDEGDGEDQKKSCCFNGGSLSGCVTNVTDFLQFDHELTLFIWALALVVPLIILFITAGDAKKYDLNIFCVLFFSAAVFRFFIFAVRPFFIWLRSTLDPQSHSRMGLIFDSLDPAWFWCLWGVCVFVFCQVFIDNLHIGQFARLFPQDTVTPSTRALNWFNALSWIAFIGGIRSILQQMFVVYFSVMQSSRMAQQWSKMMLRVHALQKLSSRVLWLRVDSDKRPYWRRVISDCNFDSRFITVLSDCHADVNPNFWNVWRLRQTMKSHNFSVFCKGSVHNIKSGKDFQPFIHDLFCEFAYVEIERVISLDEGPPPAPPPEQMPPALTAFFQNQSVQPNAPFETPVIGLPGPPPTSHASSRSIAAGGRASDWGGPSALAFHLPRAFFDTFLSSVEVEALMSLLDPDSTGKVSEVRFIRGLARVATDRRKLTSSLHAQESIASSVEIMISVNLWIISFIVWLIAIGVPILTMSVPILAVITGLSFAFGNTCKNVFDSMIFILFQYPFDVGDRVRVVGYDSAMYVAEIGLISTVFRTIHNRWVMIPNFELAKQLFINENRSFEACVEINIKVGPNITPAKLNAVRQFVFSYVVKNSFEWVPDAFFDCAMLSQPNHFNLCIFLQHRSAWFQWRDIFPSRSRFF